MTEWTKETLPGQLLFKNRMTTKATIQSLNEKRDLSNSNGSLSPFDPYDNDSDSDDWDERSEFGYLDNPELDETPHHEVDKYKLRFSAGPKGADN